MRRLQWADLVNRYVILLFAVQVIGWVVLGAAFDHDPSPFISWVQELPSGVKQALTPFVILAIPAILLNVVIGVSLELLAVRVPAPVPSMTFFINAYLLAVVGAWGITRHRTIVPEERVLVAPTAVESSRWWYWIAAYVLYVGVVFSATTLATFEGLLPPVRFRSVMGGLFVLVGIGVFVLAVAAVYVDGRSLHRADSPWRPAYSWYLLGILVGTVVYPVGPLVAAYYLYQRHRHLGSP